MKDENRIVSFKTKEQKAMEYYYKLWKCLKIALANEEKLGCHCNNIVIHLGKSVESGFTYYDPNHDSWCDYFISMNQK